MSIIQLRDSRLIGDGHSPYVIAEVNTSHFGNLDIAKEMIDKAKEADCDCVKFQSWSPESINSKSFYQENPLAARIYKKFSLDNVELKQMSDYCNEVGIGFSSTPYSKNEVDFLVNDCNVPFVKIASMELNHYDYIEYIANTGVPIVLSTGMGTMEEIRRAVEVVKSTGNKNLCVLHCVSVYPPEMHTIRLQNILGLKEAFPEYVIGFSDHSIGSEVPVAAVALGAAAIEKHMTLDKNKMGMDNQMAAEPEELSEMVRQCRNVFNALGGKERQLHESELEQRTKMRRSIVFAADLKKGAKITREDLTVKRPGTGLAPEFIVDLVGKELSRDVEMESLAQESDFN